MTVLGGACRFHSQGYRVLWKGRAVQRPGTMLAEYDHLCQSVRVRVLGSIPPHGEDQRPVGVEVFRRGLFVPQEHRATPAGLKR